MQCLNTKIKEEDLANDAYANESSSAAVSPILPTMAQSKVILSPRIEIHRIAKNHSASAATVNASTPQNPNGNGHDRDMDIAYEHSHSPNGDNLTVDRTASIGNGAERIQQLPSSVPLQHQFVSPPNNCAVLHYREHRAESSSIALPQHRVHVIKDGRFYSTTTTTTTTSSSASNGVASATTASAGVGATGPIATSKRPI